MRVRQFATFCTTTNRPAMAKRKSIVDPEELPDAADKRKQQEDDDDSGSDEVCDSALLPAIAMRCDAMRCAQAHTTQDMDMVNVDFEWFDPQPAVDFHGLKTLLRQLLDIDAQLFNLSELTDLILSQPTLGSTVKVDGNETDPYAFLTVLNLETHKVHSTIASRTTR
jgi:protein BCP1